MAQRTSPAEIRAIIDSDIDIEVQPFIDIGTALTDYVDSCDTSGKLNTALLTQIERLLSAHFYAHRDQQFKTEDIDRTKAEYQVGADGEGQLDTTQWGKSAIALDISGCLAGINKGNHHVGVSWLGKPPSEQLAYSSRD